MDRLSIFLSLAVGALVTGGFVIVVLALGYYDWRPIIGAALAGFLLSWPASYAVSRRIKRQDPDWDHRNARHAKPIPRPGAPEV